MKEMNQSIMASMEALRFKQESIFLYVYGPIVLFIFANFVVFESYFTLRTRLRTRTTMLRIAIRVVACSIEVAWHCRKEPGRLWREVVRCVPRQARNVGSESYEPKVQ